jgi:hypothetical protein
MEMQFKIFAPISLKLEEMPIFGLSMNYYRVFHLKHNPNFYTWNPSYSKWRNQWKYWTLAVVSQCWNWCTAWNWYGRNFRCLVTQWACHKHFLRPEILLPVGISVLFSTFLSGYALLNASQTATNNFNWSNIQEWKHVLLVNTPCSHLSLTQV